MTAPRSFPATIPASANLSSRCKAYESQILPQTYRTVRCRPSRTRLSRRKEQVEDYGSPAGADPAEASRARLHARPWVVVYPGRGSGQSHVDLPRLQSDAIAMESRSGETPGLYRRDLDRQRREGIR